MQQQDDVEKVWHYGLVVDLADPWLAFSPDGVVRGKDGQYELVEYKCPYRFATGPNGSPFARSPPEAPDPIYKAEEPPCGGEPIGIPSQYWVQLQVGMWVLRKMNAGSPLPWARFVVWTPKRVQFMRVPYSPYFHETLLPQLRVWYYETYLPARKKQLKGELEVGTLPLKRKR